MFEEEDHDAKYYAIHMVEPLNIEDCRVHAIPKSQVKPVCETLCSSSVVYVTFFALLLDLKLKDGSIYSVRKDSIRKKTPGGKILRSVFNLRDLQFDRVWVEFGGIFLPKSWAKYYQTREHFLEPLKDKKYKYVRYGDRCKVILRINDVHEGQYLEEDIMSPVNFYNPMEDSGVTHFILSCIVINDVKFGAEISQQPECDECKYFLNNECARGYALWYCPAANESFQPAKIPKLMNFYFQKFAYSTDEYKVRSAPI